MFATWLPRYYEAEGMLSALQPPPPFPRHPPPLVATHHPLRQIMTTPSRFLTPAVPAALSRRYKSPFTPREAALDPGVNSKP